MRTSVRGADLGGVRVAYIYYTGFAGRVAELVRYRVGDVVNVYAVGVYAAAHLELAVQAGPGIVYCCGPGVAVARVYFYVLGVGSCQRNNRAGAVDFYLDRPEA